MDHNKLWKILKEKGLPDHLTCLLRNLYAGQEETEQDMEQQTGWFQIGKGVHQGCILSPCYYAKAFGVGSQFGSQQTGKFFKRWEYQTT